MAGLHLIVASGAQSLSTSAETVLQILAAANHRVKVTGFSVTVAGTSAVDITMRVLRQTTAGTAGTTTGLLTKLDSAAAESIQTTASTNFSVEPTAGDVLQLKKLQGAYEKHFPMGQEIIVPGSGRLGIEVTVATASTIVAEFFIEE